MPTRLTNYRKYAQWSDLELFEIAAKSEKLSAPRTKFFSGDEEAAPHWDSRRSLI